jgi:hypothetical protein
MTTKRSQSVAQVQDRALVRMKVVHRRREPGPSPRSVSDPDFARLTILDAAEHVVHLARLARMAREDINDPPYWRQLVVVANALADAIEGDIKGDPDRNTEALYRRVIAQEGD